jgi:hypothetical protein
MIKRSTAAAAIAAAITLAPTLAAAQQTVRIGMGAPTLSFQGRRPDRNGGGAAGRRRLGAGGA